MVYLIRGQREYNCWLEFSLDLLAQTVSTETWRLTFGVDWLTNLDSTSLSPEPSKLHVIPQNQDDTASINQVRREEETAYHLRTPYTILFLGLIRKMVDNYRTRTHVQRSFIALVSLLSGSKVSVPRVEGDSKWPNQCLHSYRSCGSGCIVPSRARTRFDLSRSRQTLLPGSPYVVTTKRILQSFYVNFTSIGKSRV